MTFPAQVKVTFRPGIGASFGNAFVLGDQLNGVLGSNVLGGIAEAPVDISSKVQQVNIRRGKDRQFDSYNAGSCTISLIDTTGDFNPDNETGPYFGELLPGRQVRVSATYESSPAFLFSGYVTRFDWRFEPEFDANIVTISATDGFRLLTQASIETVPGAGPGDSANERINQILDKVQWPSSARDLRPCQVLVQDDPGDRRNAIEAMRAVELAALGALYIDPAGNVAFRTRTCLGLQAATVVPVVFSDEDAPAAPVVRYTALDVDLDDEEIINEVTAIRIGGTEQTRADLDSQNEYFLRSQNFTDLLLETDDQVLAFANQIVSFRSQPQLEVRGVEIEMISDNTERIEAGLTLDFGDPIEVIRTATGGPITTLLTVQGVDHDITTQSWRVRYSTARPFSLPFILGSPEYGVLGTSTL